MFDINIKSKAPCIIAGTDNDFLKKLNVYYNDSKYNANKENEFNDFDEI